MTLDQFITSQKLKQGDLAQEWGVSEAFLSRMKTGKRGIPLPLALKVFRTRKVRLDPIKNLTDAQIDALAALHGV